MSSTTAVQKVIPQVTQLPMSCAVYRGMGDELWAQHAQLARFITMCKDPEILTQIKTAREALAAAGRLADRKSLKK